MPGNRTLAVLIILTMAAAFMSPGFADAGGETWLAVVADTHVGHGPGTKASRDVYQEIGRSGRYLAVLHAGDVTEVGRPAEYDEHDAAARLAGIPVHAVAGNHDSRWAAGKDLVSERIGAGDRRVDVGGVPVLLLDSSLAGGTHGHLTQATLDWVDRQLSDMPAYQPVIVVLHHPPGYETPFMDNGDLLLDRFRDRRAVVFCGHGHLALHWQRDQADMFMVPAAMDGGYFSVRISNQQLDIFTRIAGQPAPSAPTFSVPFSDEPPAPRARTILSPLFTRVAPAPTMSTIATPEIELALPAEASVGERITGVVSLRHTAGWTVAGVQWRLNGGGWQVISLADRAGQFDVAVPGPGQHTVEVRLTARHPRRGSFETRDRSSVTARGNVATEAWTFRADDGIWATPAADARRAYVGTLSGTFVAVDLQSGEAVWELDAGSPIRTSPVRTRGLVVFGTEDGVVYGVHAVSGRIVWQTPIGAAMRGGITAGHETVYLGAGDHRLYALDVNTGRVRWAYGTGGAITTAPAVSDDLIVVGSWDGHLHAVSPSGDHVWQRQLGRPPYYAPGNGSPVIADDLVLVTTPSDPQFGRYGVHCLDLNTGRVVWQSGRTSGYSTAAALIETRDPATTGSSTVRAALPVRQTTSNISAYLSTLNGALYAVNARTGQEQWLTTTGRAMYDAAPVLAGDRLLSVSVSGVAMAHDRRDGSALWSFRLGDGYVFASPVAAGELALFATLDGRLMALRQPIGN